MSAWADFQLQLSRTGTYRSPALFNKLIYPLTFMSNDSIDSFQFGKIIILDINENSIEEKLEVLHSNVSTIEVVESDDTVEIND